MSLKVIAFFEFANGYFPILDTFIILLHPTKIER